MGDRAGSARFVLFFVGNPSVVHTDVGGDRSGGSLDVSMQLLVSLIIAGVAEWARPSPRPRALTGDRTVNSSSPAAVKTFRFASELWQFRFSALPVSFG